MDISGGLSATSTALTIVKQLRDIDKSVDEAGFKLAIAELTEALADTRIALSEAKVTISEQAMEIKSLTANIEAASAAEKCPKCKVGEMSVTKTAPYSVGLAGRNGVQLWTKTCGNSECQHEDKIIHDPNSFMSKS